MFVKKYIYVLTVIVLFAGATSCEKGGMPVPRFVAEDDSFVVESLEEELDLNGKSEGGGDKSGAEIVGGDGDEDDDVIVGDDGDDDLDSFGGKHGGIGNGDGSGSGKGSGSKAG